MNDDASLIKVEIKSINAFDTTVEINASATVLELKILIENSISVSVSQQKLVYLGRVLKVMNHSLPVSVAYLNLVNFEPKDDLTLDHYEIDDGKTVHMLKGVASSRDKEAYNEKIRAALDKMSHTNHERPQKHFTPFSCSKPCQAPQAPSQPSPSSSSSSSSSCRMERLQQHLLKNPEKMQQILSSPMMESLLSDPKIIENIVANHPQMKAWVESNPEMGHLLKNPAVRTFSNVFPHCYIV